MADTNDKLVLGRKIFFVNPSYTIEKTVIARLRTMEYETYIISDYRMAKNSFLIHKHAIVYICIDGGMSKEGWKNFISMLSTAESFKDLDIGVISEDLPEHKKEAFEKDLNLTAGLYAMIGTENTLREVVKNLDRLEAKGMRKYVRVNCFEDKKTELYWFTKKDSKMFRLKLVDISSVGVAARIPMTQSNAVFVNQLISDARIIIGTRHIPVVVKVTTVKATEDFLLVVMMFTVDNDKLSLDQIRNYVSETIQENFENSIKGYALDKTNYELLAKREADKQQ